MQTEQDCVKNSIIDLYDKQFEKNRDLDINQKKKKKNALTECIAQVAGEVTMKICFALTLAFCIGC